MEHDLLNQFANQRKKIVLCFWLSCFRLNSLMSQPSPIDVFLAGGLGLMAVFRAELCLQPSSFPICVLFFPGERGCLVGSV